MQRAWSLALVVALGLALTGCRSQPQVAAYVGDKQYTNDDVDRYGVKTGELRQLVLSSLVVRDVGTPLVKEMKAKTPNPDVEGAAKAFNLPSDSPAAKLIADASAVVQALSATVPPVPPTEEFQREVFAGLTFQGQLVSKYTKFEQIRQLLSQEQIGSGFAVRSVLDQAVTKAHVTVNPRYVPLRYPMVVTVADPQGNEATSLVFIPLGAGSVASTRA
jgi:hypothetical protein